MSALLAILVAFNLRQALEWEGGSLSIGAGDFSSYWAGFQVFWRGENPYEPGPLIAEQRKIGFERDQNFMVWPAPWIFILLSPVLILDFPAALLTWLGMNFVFLAGASVLAWRLFDSSSRIPPAAVCLLAGALQVPVWKNFETGQLALLMSLSLLGIHALLERRRDLEAGALLVFLSFKPHLLLPWALAFGVWVVVERRWRVVLGCASASAVLLMILLSMDPAIMERWLTLSSGWGSRGAGPLIWKTASPATLLREAFSNSSGGAPLWPVMAVPAIGLSLTMLWIARLRGRISWSEHLYPLIAISLFSAPYCWIADLSLLLPLQVATARYRFAHAAPRRLIGWLVALQLIGIAAYELLPEVAFCLYPPAMYAIWRSARRSAAAR